MREHGSFFARALSIVHRRDDLGGVAMGYVYSLVAGFNNDQRSQRRESLGTRLIIEERG